MTRLEHITLPALAFEAVFASAGYQMTAARVSLECFMPASPSNKPLRVVLEHDTEFKGVPTLVVPRSRAVLDCERPKITLPSAFDVTELVDIEQVTELVREWRADKAEDELHMLARRAGLDISFAKVMA
jgi:hypothetical protein